MPRIYKTARGRAIDIESILAVNEESIAVGNMKVNARGDQLGPGGVVVKSRNESISDHYQVSETVDDKMARQRLAGASTKRSNISTKQQSEVNAMPEDDQGSTQNTNESSELESEQSTEVGTENSGRRMRGSLADSLAKEATVTQEKQPDPRRRANPGPARIK